MKKMVGNESEVLNKWNQKWKEYVKELISGEQKLKTLLEFDENGMAFLMDLQFISAFWYDNHPDTENCEFDVDFTSQGIEYVLTGDYGIEMRFRHENPPVNQDALFDVFTDFEINEMITENDPYEGNNDDDEEYEW